MPSDAVKWQAELKFPTTCFVAYMLAADIPFGFSTEYGAYMPLCASADQLCEVTYGWLRPLVNTIKHDLIALGRWDRHDAAVVLVYALGRWVCGAFARCEACACELDVGACAVAMNAQLDVGACAVAMNAVVSVG